MVVVEVVVVRRGSIHRCEKDKKLVILRKLTGIRMKKSRLKKRPNTKKT